MHKQLNGLYYWIRRLILLLFVLKGSDTGLAVKHRFSQQNCNCRVLQDHPVTVYVVVFVHARAHV